MIVVRAVAFAAGVLVVIGTLGSAVRTVILPRAVPARLTRRVFLSMRAVFRLRAGPKAPYERRDRVMALYAPMSLLALVATWLVTVLVGYAAMFWGLEAGAIYRAFVLSGSSLLTLGTEFARSPGASVLVFSEAALGLLLLALLITFLPNLYSNFSRRETFVALLEVRAGSPPTAVEMISRYWRIHGLERLDDLWPQWEVWFAELEETHTSFPALNFFRSPQPSHSWVTAAGAVLDGASLRASTLEGPREPSAELCIRAGYVALRRIAAFFRISFDPDPSPTDPICVSKEEYDQAYDRLEQEGVPLKPDRIQAWRDFAGWRVNYDRVLVALAALIMAPETPWSSDRTLTDYRPERGSILRRREASDVSHRHLFDRRG